MLRRVSFDSCALIFKDVEGFAVVFDHELTSGEGGPGEVGSLSGSISCHTYSFIGIIVVGLEQVRPAKRYSCIV